jgi:hypothetical protein
VAEELTSLQLKEIDMGEANSRGTQEERREEALWRDAEVVVFLCANGNALSMGVMPQSNEPDQDGLATIFAGFLNANFPELLKAAKKAYDTSRTAVPGIPAKPEAPALVTDVTPKLVGTDGPVTGEVKLLDPSGRPLQ